MASIKSSSKLLPQSDDLESNSGSERSSKNLIKWIGIGLFIFFFLILLVLITAICLVFVEVISVEPNHVSIANVKPNVIYEIEDLPEEKQVPIESNVITNALVTLEADFSQLVRQPTDQKVELGKETILNCAFDHKVHCRWLRKSNLVDISGRYSYVESEKEDGNHDCSIKITNIKEIDLFSWQCLGIFNDQSSLVSDEVALQISQVQKQDKTKMVVSPKDVTAQIGNTVRLDCEFNQKVNCAWMRRGEHIEIHGRYEFVKQSDASDELLSDCSITIREVKKIDDGDWICSSMADSNSSGIRSPAIKLTLT